MRSSTLILSAALGATGFIIGSQRPTPSKAPDAISTGHGSTTTQRTGIEAPLDTPPQTDRASQSTELPKQIESFQQLDGSIKRGSTNPADQRFRLMTAINALSADQLGRMLEKELGSDLFLRSDRFDFKYAAARLGEIAPQKAAELWASRGEARSFSTDLISPWARRDPVAFATWTMTQSEEVQRAARETLSQAAAKDPALFTSIAHQLASSPNAAETARAAVKAFIEKETSPEQQISYASRLPEGTMRNAALTELAASTSLDLPSHPEIIRALADLPEREAHKLGPELAKKVDSLPPGAVREAAMQQAVREQARTDPAAAARRLESLPSNSSDYAAAVRGFVDSTSAKDPASAAEWALSIPQNASPHRTGALDRVATEYFRTNPDGAREWVEKAPLSDDEYRRLTGRIRSTARP